MTNNFRGNIDSCIESLLIKCTVWRIRLRIIAVHINIHIYRLISMLIFMW